MGKQNKSAIEKNCFIIALVLCVIALILGFVKRGFEDSYYTKDLPEEIEISSVDDLIAKKDSIHNDRIVLKKDITITESSLCFSSDNYPFVGEFDGNGHTVFINFGDEGNDDYSLFGSIGEDGIVKNTYFSFGTVKASTNVYAGIANINYGTIKDCKISFKRLKMRGNDGVFSPCVAFNYGTITNVLVSCTFDCEMIDETKNSIAFGTICSYNYGTLQNSIALPQYVGLKCVNEEDLLLSDKTKNSDIAAVCPFTTSAAQTINLATVLANGIYTCDKNNSAITVFSSQDGLFNNATVFNDLAFDNRVWKFVGKDLILTIEGL